MNEHPDAPLILIVEDEPKLAELLRDYLELAGYRSRIIGHGNQVIDGIKRWQPDLMLLDLMLPGCDGMTLCREVRLFSDLPIIMVTARVEEIDRLLGLEIGADDYVCKPYSPREVVARVKANLRRIHALTAEQQSVADGFELDEARHHALFKGQPLDLTPVEFRLLTALLSTPSLLSDYWRGIIYC